MEKITSPPKNYVFVPNRNRALADAYKKAEEEIKKEKGDNYQKYIRENPREFYHEQNKRAQKIFRKEISELENPSKMQKIGSGIQKYMPIKRNLKSLI